MKIVLASQEEIDTFYAVRPEWFETDEERKEFAEQHSELVNRYSDCWEDHTHCLPQVAAAAQA